ncbi:MAG: HD domain-containing protein [Erysipelotrichaceae bacterium]
MSKKIINLKEKDSLTIRVLISNVNKGVTNSGAPYMSLTLQDTTGNIEAKYWDVKPAQSDIIEQGKVYDVQLEVIKYRNNLQGKIHLVTLCDENEVDLNDFVKTSEVPMEELKSGIKSYINAIENPIIHQVIVEVMKIYHEDFFAYPAASKNHHNFVGGLATHVLGMLNVAKDMADLYPILSRDLLYAGVILHDIGKIDELSGAFMTEYTMKGKLLGHISIMQAHIYEISKKLGYEESEEVTLLRHLILSHHGQLEYGSPVLPMIAEAEMLQFIDNIDARMEMLKRTFETTENQQFTARLFALENRSFYKHDK